MFVATFGIKCFVWFVVLNIFLKLQISFVLHRNNNYVSIFFFTRLYDMIVRITTYAFQLHKLSHFVKIKIKNLLQIFNNNGKSLFLKVYLLNK